MRDQRRADFRAAEVRLKTSGGIPASCISDATWRLCAAFAGRAWQSRCCPPPAPRATCPRKIASGKFHGLMQTKTPRPAERSVLRSPTGRAESMLRKILSRAARRNNGRNRPPRGFRRAHRDCFAGLPDQQVPSAAAALFQQDRTVFQGMLRASRPACATIPIGLPRGLETLLDLASCCRVQRCRRRHAMLPSISSSNGSVTNGSLRSSPAELRRSGA